MTKSICYICDTNLPYRAYNGSKFLDESGNKPCLECLVEEGAFGEEDESDKEG
jgi:hypothetical protein